MFCVAVFAFVHQIKKLNEKLGALLALLLLLPSIVVLALNSILIARLSPQLNYFIHPSSLKMGFFNPLEISQIQNGSYAKTSTFEQQIIGNLGDVVYSSNKALYDERCDVYNQDCTYIYMRTYSYQITCTNQSAAFYKDCTNAFSLTIYVIFVDSGPYSSYNCRVNQANEKCASSCTQLLSNYELVLIQEFKPNQIQPAWTGLSNCYTNINNQLRYNLLLNPCSFAMKKSASVHVLHIGMLLALFLEHF